MTASSLPATWDARDRGRLFDEVPSGVVILDPEMTVVDHNAAFTRIFGDALGQTCYRAIKGRSTACSACPARSTFTDGRTRVIEQTGNDLSGRRVHYLVQVSPMSGPDGGADFVAAMITDLTATRRLQQEYQTLFEKVPCFVAVINRGHRVVKANEAFRRVFGEPTGEPCYRLYKRRHDPCPDCPVDRTFADGLPNSSRQMGVSRDGRPTPYLVFTAPLLHDDDEVTHVIEMALDLTEHQELELKLNQANVMRKALVESSLDAIVVFNDSERVLLANAAAERLLGFSTEELIGRRASPRLVPKDLRDVIRGRRERILLQETELKGADGEPIPVRMAAVALRVNGRFMGSAVVAQDLRELKALEHDKLEAERMAAVGQTVAGLAHGIKNIITGLEGGMYVTSTGLKKGDQERVQKGWDMLVRNMSRISELTKNLLAFSRGETPRFERADPSAVVREVVELFRDKAAEEGIEIRAEIADDVAAAWIDPEGIHSAIANLVSNAVDACMMSEREGCTITVRLLDRDDALVVEVVDTGCGMDYEVKQKAFTSFFTTKASGGTGLGLLLTRKIVQQHGGIIDLESRPGVGTTFRIRFPRERLPKPPHTEEAHDG
jgi:PAS domain S-box-containing protein